MHIEHTQKTWEMGRREDAESEGAISLSVCVSQSKV